MKESRILGILEPVAGFDTGAWRDDEALNESAI